MLLTLFLTCYADAAPDIPALAELFPRARFVSIVRDGRAVACSLSRVHWWPDLTVWWYGGTPGRWQEEGRDPWELCARHWVRELAVLEQGLGFALKVEDGATRAQYPAVLRMLQLLGALPERLSPRLAEYGRTRIRNTRGEVVGELLPAGA